jgi:long-subunit fatty acid transport protein
MIRASRRLLMLVGISFAARAWAAGPESPETTARVLGRAGAAVASAEDLSALDEDPAALGRLGSQAMASVTAISRADEISGARNRADASVLAFGAASVGLGRATLAAGVLQAADTARRFQITETALLSASFSRLVVPVGVGVRLRGLLVGVTARAERIDDAWGAAGGFGILVAPNAPISAAAAVTTPAAGHATTPWTARGGIRIRSHRVDGEVAGSYEAWSALPGMRDSGSVRAGLDVMLLPWLTARAGWSWEPAAVDPAQLSAYNLDLDHHTGAAGATVCSAGLCVDLAYAHAFAFATQGGTGNNAGRYDSASNIVSLSLRLDFAAARQSATADQGSH